VSRFGNKSAKPWKKSVVIMWNLCYKHQTLRNKELPVNLVALKDKKDQGKTLVLTVREL
jgi:hypothetical protein